MHSVDLDPNRRCADAIEFENELRERFIGQEEAVATAARMVQTYMAGMNNPDQPAGIMLAPGPARLGFALLPHLKSPRAHARGLACH